AAGKEVHTIRVPGTVVSLAFSPDGVHIAGACSKPSHVRLWNLQTEAQIGTFEGHESDLSSVAFSPDGRRLASSGWDHTIKVWDVAEGKKPVARGKQPKPPLTIQRHSDVVSQVCFSPDGRYIASASWDGIVGLWDSSTGKEVRTYRGHTGNVNSVAFSPDGESLASAGADHQVKVWDVMTQQEGRRVQFPYAHPHGLAFSPDGKLLAAADGSIYGTPHKTLAIYDART